MIIMKEVLIEKVVVNMGVGSEPEKMKKSEQVIKLITSKKPVKRSSIKRIPDWDLRPGVPIGLKVTLRGAEAAAFLKNAFLAKDNKLNIKSFDKEGNFGFGIKEHIDLQRIKYDPKLGIMGFDVLVTLKKKGFRVKMRKLKNEKIGHKQRVNKEEAQEFVRSMGVEVQ